MLSFLTNKIQLLTEPLGGLSWAHRCFLRLLLLGVKELITLENLEAEKISSDPLIFVFNHNCSYESLLIPACLIYRRGGRKISFIIDWMYGRYPVLGWLFRGIDPVYVYNKPSKIKLLNRFRLNHRERNVYDECLRRLSAGESIGLFPEGTRNRHPYHLLKGRKGIGRIVLESQAPVLPVGIDFPSRLRSGRIPKFGPLIMRGGELMSFPEETALYQQVKATERISQLERKKLLTYLTKKVTFTIMNELARLSGKIYPFPAPIMSGESSESTGKESILKF